MKRSSIQLKQLARQLLHGKYGTFIGSYFILSLITSAIAFIPAFSISRTTAASLLVTNLINLILSLVTSVFTAGLMQMSLNASRNRPFGIENLFYGFTHHPDRIIVVGILNLLISFACMIPLILLLIIVITTDSYTVFVIWGLILLALCCMVVSYIILIQFSLAIYLLLDNHEMGAIDAMRTSAHLMKGNKGRYFYLNISFFGVVLLGILSLGIGMLWVEPYMMVTNTQFYREIIGELDHSANEETLGYENYNTVYNDSVYSNEEIIEPAATATDSADTPSEPSEDTTEI